jgi:hypothetical protein
MNKRTMYIVVAVIVILIIVVGVAAALLLNNGSGTPSTTPTPTPTATTAPSAGDATSITFNANITSGGTTIEYKWAGRNIHSTNITIRTDFATYAYVLDASTQSSKMSTDSGATWTTSTFTTDWPSWDGQFSEYVDALTAHWTGQDYTFQNAAGETITLFNVVINPTIPDSTFAVS